MFTGIVAVARNRLPEIGTLVPGAVYLPPGLIETGDYHGVEVLSTRILLSPLARGYTLPWTSSAADGTWDVGFIWPLSIDREFFCKVYRWLRRNNGDHVRGPWAPSVVAAQFPAFADAYLRRTPGGPLTVPVVPMGVDPEELAGETYNPSQSDIDSDVPYEPPDPVG